MARARRVQHAPTGIAGFDEVSGGGLPRGRISVVLGGAGSGKTIFGLQALVAGATSASEPGMFVAFEESPKQVLENTASFRWKVSRLVGQGIELFDARLSPSIIHGGDFDLLGLLATLGSRCKQMGAKRIVLDGLDVLLGNLADPALVRREVFRLQEWLQTSGMTAVITAKSDPLYSSLARASASLDRTTPDYDFLQFMADCVVTLEHRVVAGTALRFLRVAKHRGVAHSANEVPFRIGPTGIEVAPVGHGELHHRVSSERVSSGVARLDAMLAGGYYRGSSTLITGAPGVAKTTLAAAFAEAACARKERTLFISFDESPEQIVRNVLSVGIALGPLVESGMLRMCSLRSRGEGPDAHISRIRALLHEHKARNLVIDPISAMAHTREDGLAEAAAQQLVDLAKSAGITSVNTSLLGNQALLSEQTPIGLSTLADTWIHLSYASHGGERNRALTIIKSRGTGHSNQVRELLLSDAGLSLADVYQVGGEVLMGTLRWHKENEQRRQHELARLDAELREREAKLALAETTARLQVLLGEQAVREATVARLAAQRLSTSSEATSQTLELRERRGDDVLLAVRAKRPKGSRR